MSDCDGMNAEYAMQQTPAGALLGQAWGDRIPITQMTPEEQAKVQAEQDQYRLRCIRETAMHLAIQCFGAGAPDWQNVVRAARDIVAFLENG